MDRKLVVKIKVKNKSLWVKTAYIFESIGFHKIAVWLFRHAIEVQ